MVDLRSQINNLTYLVRANYNLFFNNNQSIYSKIKFFTSEIYCTLLDKREINYFGKRFAYDNRFAPILIAEYNSEIKKINKVLPLKNIKSAIDIGANVGQWGFTVKSLYDHVELHSFEPNKMIFSILKANSAKIKSWKVYNYAIGSKDEKKSFYFSKEASAEGSLYKENTSRNADRGKVEEIKIDIIRLDKKNLSKLKIPKKVDLIKIDVEGFESEVIKGLTGIETKYIYVEIPRKDGDKKELEKMRKHVEKYLGKKANVLAYDVPTKNSSVANALFEMN